MEGTSINFEKSKFFQTSVSYLGHIIDGQGILADVERVSRLPNLINKPNNIKELRAILGLINWYRPYLRM